jgi:hypothetical protein
MSQMWPSKVGGGEGGGVQMVETKNHRTLGRLLPNTQKKFFESRSIAFMVQKWFVDHKVALLQHFKSRKLNKKWENYEHWK